MYWLSVKRNLVPDLPIGRCAGSFFLDGWGRGAHFVSDALEIIKKLNYYYCKGITPQVPAGL